MTFVQRCFRATQRCNTTALPTNDCAAVTWTVKRCNAFRLSETIGRVETATSQIQSVQSQVQSVQSQISTATSNSGGYGY